MSQTKQLILPGEAGDIEVAINEGTSTQPTGVAIIAHPHPLFGGSMDNKVVTTLMRAFNDCGVTVWRFNFRGVGKSAGVHDDGPGEVRDALQVIATALAQTDSSTSIEKPSEDALNTAISTPSPLAPLFIAGFSFGGAVMLRAQLLYQQRIQQQSLAQAQSGNEATTRAMHCALVAPAMWQRFGGETPPNVALSSLIVHGDRDDTVPLEQVMNWARLQGLPVTVVPDGEHFFHGRLGVLKDLTSNWCRGRLAG